MVNEHIIQRGLIINGDNSGNSSIITFDDNTGGQIGRLIFNHDVDAFVLEVDGVAQWQATKTSMTIAGDLTVLGTVATVNSTDLAITDNIITVNNGEVGAGVGGGIGAAGILVDRGSLTDAGWFFNDALGKQWWGPTGPGGVAGEGGASQKIGNIAAIDSTDSPQEILTFLSAGAIIPPSSGTAARDILITVPSSGMTRYNTDLAALEVYDGVDWATVLASSGGIVPAAGDIDLVNTFKIINPKTPIAGNEIGDRDDNDARYLQIVNDLSDVSNAATARTNLAITPANIGAVAIAGDTMTGDLVMNGANIEPLTNLTQTVGTLTKQFTDMYATNFNGQATSALYADLAERYEADADYEPGTVLIYGGEVEVTTTKMYADTRVAGVVSTKPAFKMNSGAGFSDTHPYVALKGKVPCKVSGYIQKGDLLVTSSEPGYAVSVEHDRVIPYTAFARANEDFDGKHGVINVSII